MTWADLTKRFGSPLYVYDLEEVRAAHRALCEVLPAPSDVYYSLKANPHPALVGELHRLGCRAEVTSAGELRSAMAARVPAASTLYTGPAKSCAEIAYAIDNGVRLFSVDSPSQLRRLDEVARRADRRVQAIVRVNSDHGVGGLGLTMTGSPSQFGADTRWIEQRPEAFTSRGHVAVRGFHFYMGTDVAEQDVLLRTFESGIEDALRLSAATGIALDVLDLGGGFAHPFARAGERPSYPDLKSKLEDRLDDALPGWRLRRPSIAFESGRYLVGGAGTLVCTVQDVKASKDRTFVLLDTGINHLGGMSGLRRVPRIAPSLDPVDGTEGECSETTPCDVVGPLCTPLDSWARGVALGALSPGDVVAVPNVGAYGLTGSLIGFLSHDPPVELVLDGDRLRDASRLVLTRIEQRGEEHR